MGMKAIVRMSLESSSLKYPLIDIELHIKNINSNTHQYEIEDYLVNLTANVRDAMYYDYGEVSRMEWLGTTEEGFIDIILVWE